tara:strand:+ start:474 stop:767 length:294 start_codon:yes stop_codon:yes gene_type:complete
MSNGPIWAMAIAAVLLSLLAYVAYLESFSKMPKETGIEEPERLPDWGSRWESRGVFHGEDWPETTDPRIVALVNSDLPYAVKVLWLDELDSPDPLAE